jgi:N-acetylmuramoyl-L-alanine amidase
MALTIFFEAGGESADGKIAVANVIKNRVNHNKFPNTYAEVIFQPRQFSCYDTREIHKSFRRFHWDSVLKCFVIAEKVYYDIIPDNTHGALFYTRVEIKRVWMKNLKKKAIIGNHKFLKYR